MNIRSRCRNPVIGNVHFEPELTPRSLRERLRLVIPQWPPYPEAVGVIVGDFNICEPEEGRFNVWNQSFTDVVAGKAALFHSSFPHVLRIAQPDFTRRDSTTDGTIRTLFRIDGAFINLPMAEAHERLPLLFSCPRELWKTVHTEWCRHTETDYSGSPGQTHSKLDVQTSLLLLNF